MDEPRRLLVVVEDDRPTRSALEGLFSRRGSEVRSAAGVAEVLALLSGGPAPNGLILDLMLPDGDGEEVLRRVPDVGRARSL